MEPRFKVNAKNGIWKVWDTTDRKYICHKDQDGKGQDGFEEHKAKDYCRVLNLREFRGNDARSWEQQAHWLNRSAHLHWETLQGFLKREKPIVDLDAQMIAAFNTFLMLTGFALENMIKGALVAQTPQLSIEKRYKIWGEHKSGHGLTGLIGLLDPPYNTTDPEESLLKRCQEYAISAGRYPITKSAMIDMTSHTSRPDDPQIAEGLFLELSKRIAKSVQPEYLLG